MITRDSSLAFFVNQLDAFDVDGDLFGVGDDAWGIPVGVHAHGIHVAVSGERGGSGEHEIARALELGSAGGFIGMARAGDGGEFESGGVWAFAAQTEVAGGGRYYAATTQ